MDVQGYVDRYLREYRDYHGYWNYEDGCVLLGCVRLHEATGEKRYRDFVLRYLSRRVADGGAIPSYDLNGYNIDSVNCGKALFFAWHETGEAKWRSAVEFIRQRLETHPRCENGSYWHKGIYPRQVWLDGLYMAQPFLMEYEMAFGGMKLVADIVRQFENARRCLFDEAEGLYRHGWDETRSQPWCDPETGRSQSFWLRGMGWYLMALADCLGLVDERLFEHKKALEALFREAVRGLLSRRNGEGLFCQVVDQTELPGNYSETSGSAMAAYALMKGTRIGALSEEKYWPAGRALFDALVKLKLRDENSRVSLCDICKVAGLGREAHRDGSAVYYLSEPVVADDPKGTGPFMMAWAETLTRGKGYRNGRCSR